VAGAALIQEAWEQPAAAAARTVTEVLAEAAAVEPPATGALVLGQPGRPEGTIFLEDGRVCWAAVTGMSRRLTDLLVETSSAPAARARVEDVYRRCRHDGKPLGEALVADGVVCAKGLSRALRRHTAEALLALAESGARAVGWIARRHRRYDATFTFSPAELLVAAGEIASPEAAAEAAAVLAEVLEGEAPGVAFTRAFSGPSPICLAGTVDLGLADLLAMGRWARGAIDQARALSTGMPVVLGMHGSGSAVIGWERGAAVYAALCAEPSSVAWVFAKLERGRASGKERP
jgi:hypothetical protein